MFGGYIACSGIWLLYVLSFYVQQDFPLNLLDSHIAYIDTWLLHEMFSCIENTFWSLLVAAFMYCLFMSSNISLWPCLMVTLPVREFDFFMFWPFVLSKITFWSYLVVTLYLTPSCTAILCLARYPFELAWLSYCLQVIWLMCSARLSCEVAR